MITIEKIRIGDQLDRAEFEEKLRQLRYQKCEFVSRPGEFAVRGRIFDVYPVTYRAPIRIEFEVDKVAAIRDFSPYDGKTLMDFEELFLIPLSESLEKKLVQASQKYEAFEPLSELKDLLPGDQVVHITYGIGRFLGTKTIQQKGIRKKHLAIEYANKEILYLPLGEALERYIGTDGKAPKLTKLHGKEWERIKDRTRRAVKSIASDLIQLQARRSHHRGFPFPKDHAWQKEFEAEFPYEETKDQDRAVREVKKDMERPHPMDRLLAGDVGYGKTEVAIRAAFKCVTGGRQVAFLVPTTVLAEQHYLVIKRRIEKYPVTVEVLSRFRSKKDQTGIVECIKNGTADIVVGTHRLLSKDIRFKDLGLIIVDEEQRFGVKHKEKLKQMRTQVDVLTLTATPIPRTLHMSLVGVRDMSVINTPPKMRLPIVTHVMPYHDEKIKDAIEYELARGGQVYFVHNRVQSIENVFEHLRTLLPHVRFGVAHGQMQPHILEAIMTDFMEGQLDCLIATSIIESGIDIPNVNTIIVNRADQFGLADLYQLRGRVGRYHTRRQAFAYFLTPKDWVLTRDAEKRLAAIERFTELGSGFKIALEDMQIRGAGNLLGHEQSGFIHAVGFDLYCRMLRDAVKKEIAHGN